jgi:hypothetical protein
LTLRRVGIVAYAGALRGSRKPACEAGLTGACFSMKKARRNLIAARFCYCCVRYLPGYRLPDYLPSVDAGFTTHVVSMLD